MSVSSKDLTVSLAECLSENRDQILASWLQEMSGATKRADLMKDIELRNQAKLFLNLFETAVQSGNDNLNSAAWSQTKEMLQEISTSRAHQGFSPSETATFVLSLKRPIFDRLRQEFARDPEVLTSMLWSTTELLDGLGLYTAEAFIKMREEVIRRQQEEMLELSTPVVKLWDGIVSLPLVGTLDSARTQVVMESLLNAIVQTNSKIAIIDITGVPTVDTIVAQHLLKTVTAARLMGAECIISGIRPQIAQTIVHLGINLMDITTKATMNDALILALRKLGITSVRNEKPLD